MKYIDDKISQVLADKRTILLQAPWTPANEEQAESRFNRGGFVSRCMYMDYCEEITIITLDKSQYKVEDK